MSNVTFKSALKKHRIDPSDANFSTVLEVATAKLEAAFSNVDYGAEVMEETINVLSFALTGNILTPSSLDPITLGQFASQIEALISVARQIKELIVKWTQPKSGHLRSAAEMNKVFEIWNADRDSSDKLNDVCIAVIENVTLTVGMRMKTQPPLHQREDIALDTVQKVLRHLPGNPSFDSALTPFDATRVTDGRKTTFNAFVETVAQSTAVDYFRKNSDSRLLTIDTGFDEALGDSTQPTANDLVELIDEERGAVEVVRMQNGPFEAAEVKRKRGRPKLTGPRSLLSRHKRLKFDKNAETAKIVE